MRERGRSHTAQYVAQVRALLHDKGVIDDPYAIGILTVPMRALTVGMRLAPVPRWSRSPFLAALATRILFFDRQVNGALDDGVSQVVIIGAGYDTRAWRFARPRAAFYEVDHPATQRDKIDRAPPGGPTYVAVDLSVDPVVDALAASGFDVGQPALFVIEGVTMYLTEVTVRRLLSELAEQAAPDSRLAVNFAAPPRTGSSADRRRQRVLRALGAAGGERHRFFLAAADAAPFVASTGWHVVRAEPLQEQARFVPHSTSFPIDRMNPEPTVVSGRLVSRSDK